MKRSLFISALLFFCSLASAQVRPDNFTEVTAPDSSNFEVYSQKNGLPRRANLWNLKKYYVPGVDVNQISFVPTPTGNTDSLTQFVQTAGDSIYYIDGAGNATLLFDPNQFQTLSSSNDTIFLTAGGYVVVVSTLSNLTDVDTSGIQTDDYLQWNGSAWVPAAVSLPSGIVTGTGSTGFLPYWDTDTTINYTSIGYTATVLDASALTGALKLPSGTTAQDPTWSNGMIRYDSDLTAYKFYPGRVSQIAESSATSFNPGEVIIGDPQGRLSDTTIAAILSIGGAPTGSGASGRVAYWNGASTLTGSSTLLWDGSQLSVGTTNSTYTIDVGTGGLRLGAESGDITGAAGVLEYYSWFKGHDGSNWYYLPKAAAESWTTGYIPYSNGSALTASANLYYSGGNLYVGNSGSFKILYGAGTPSIVIGDNISVSLGSSAVGIKSTSTTLSNYGVAINGRATGQYSTAVGYDARADTNTGNSAFGSQAQATSTNNCTALGYYARAHQPNTLAVGGNSYASATSSHAIGQSATASGASSLALGNGANTAHTNSIALGVDAKTTANFQMVVGTITTVAGVSQRGYIDNIYFGSGVQRNNDAGAGISYTINGSGAYGTDYAGGNVTIAGGKGTGAGTPGYVSFSTSTAGASSSTLQSLTERFRMDGYSLYGYGYGSGTITGTPTYWAAWTSGGKFIETTYINDDVQAEVSSTTTATVGAILPVNSTGGAITVDVPTSGIVSGSWFAVSKSRAGTNDITIDFATAGVNLHGASSATYTMNSGIDFVRFTYVDSTVGWIKSN